MKYLKLTIIICFILIENLSITAQTTVPNNLGVPDVPNDPGWVLEWSDEFDGPNLNTSIWTVKNRFDNGQWTYGSLGSPIVFLDDNVSMVSDVSGNTYVNLTLKREEYYCPPPLSQYECSRQWASGLPYQYTGGFIESKYPYTADFGYIEAKVIIPCQHGLWPSFWTFRDDSPANPSPTNAAEIDIFEMLGEKPCNVMTSNLHTNYISCNSSHPCWDSSTGGCPQDLALCPQSQWYYKYYKETTLSSNYSDVPKIFSLKWTPDRIYWYVDNVLVRDTTNYMIGQNIIDPVMIMLDITIRWNVYTDSQGNQQVDLNLPPNATTTLPANFLIDYIRVYDMKMDCTTPFSTCNFDFIGWQNEVKKSITIGGCPNVQPTSGQGSYTSLRATDFILINGNYTVPLGAKTVIETVTCY